MNDEGEVKAALYDLFCARAGDLHVDVERVADACGLAALVARYAGDIGAATVIVAHELVQEMPELAAVLAETGVNWTGSRSLQEEYSASVRPRLPRSN